MDFITESGTQVRCQVQALKHFMRYVEFGCGNKNMGMWVGKNKKNGWGVDFTRWNVKN
jgi:hypothetical protein